MRGPVSAAFRFGIMALLAWPVAAHGQTGLLAAVGARLAPTPPLDLGLRGDESVMPVSGVPHSRQRTASMPKPAKKAAKTTKRTSPPRREAVHDPAPHHAIDYTPTASVAVEPAVDPGALAKTYCSAVAESVNDARAKWQEARLRELEAALEKKAAELASRLDEMRAFAAAREDAAKKAEENVLAIYGKMKPESAAAQIAAMEENLAAAILSRLNPRAASLILNEITAEKAARLTNTMAPRKLAPPPAEKTLSAAKAP